MPAITLRSLRSDLALKLDQLEMRAAVLERDARAAMPVDLPPQPEPFGARAASMVADSVGTIARLARGACAWTLRTIESPRLAFALRVVRARFNEAALSAAIAGVLLLSLLIALVIAAPPE